MATNTSIGRRAKINKIRVDAVTIGLVLTFYCGRMVDLTGHEARHATKVVVHNCNSGRGVEFG